MKIKRTGAADYGQFIKALIVGNPGSGKTLISSTFPNPIYASAEGGLMSIADRDIPYIDIKSTDDLLKLKNILAQDKKVRDETLGFEVQTVVIDTIDEIQKIMVDERLKSKNQQAMVLQDWGWLLNQMTAMVTEFRNLPLNVVFTCHLKEINDGDTGRIHYKPDMQGAIADKIPGYVDLSLLLTSDLVQVNVDNKLEKVERRTLVTAPSLTYPFLKDRSGKLPAELVVDFESDFDRIKDLIYGNLDIKDTVEIEVPYNEPEPEDEAVQEEAVKEVSEPKEEGPKNELPKGVKPVNKGFGINYYCEECGNEVETNKRVEMSKIRLKNKIYCDEHYNKHMEEQK